MNEKIVIDLTGVYASGEALLRAERYREAVKFFEELVAVDSSQTHQTQAYMGLAQAYMGLGKKDKAKENFKKVVGFCPQGPRAWLELGKIYFQEKNWEQSKSNLEKALTLAQESEPQNLLILDILYNLGAAWVEKGCETQNIQAIDQGIERTKEAQEFLDKIVKNALGVKWGKEIEAAETVLRFNLMTGYLYQGQTYLNQSFRPKEERYQEALKSFQEAKKYSQQEVLVINRLLSLIYLEMGQIAEAKPIIREVLQKDPDYLGKMLDDDSLEIDWGEVKNLFQEMYETEKDEVVRENLLWLLAKTGHEEAIWDRIERTKEQLLRLKEKKENKPSPEYQIFGDWLKRLGQTKQTPVTKFLITLTEDKFIKKPWRLEPLVIVLASIFDREAKQTLETMAKDLEQNKSKANKRLCSFIKELLENLEKFILQEEERRTKMEAKRKIKELKELALETKAEVTEWPKTDEALEILEKEIKALKEKEKVEEKLEIQKKKPKKSFLAKISGAIMEKFKSVP